MYCDNKLSVSSWHHIGKLTALGVAICMLLAIVLITFNWFNYFFILDFNKQIR